MFYEVKGIKLYFNISHHWFSSSDLSTKVRQKEMGRKQKVWLLIILEFFLIVLFIF